MKKWLFIFIILLLVVGMFFMFMTQYDFGGKTLAKIFKIDRPISYPTTISQYILSTDSLSDEKCQDIKSLPDAEKLSISGEFCASVRQLEYSYGNKVVRIGLAKFSRGLELYEKIVLAISKPVETTRGIIFTSEPNELVWFYNNNYIVMTQQNLKVPLEDGSANYISENFSIDNPVIGWFLDNYQPREV